MSKVLLKYIFLFDPVEGWSHLSQFENDLTDFFTANGLQATVIEAIKGQMGERIMELSRMDFVSRATNNNQTVREEMPASDQIKSIQNKLTPQHFKKFQSGHGVPINAKVSFKNSQKNRVSFKQRLNNPYTR